MLVTELKPREEILGYLRDGERIFLVACGGCAAVCETGGETAVKEIGSALEAAGHRMEGAVVIPFLCNKALVGIRLSRLREAVEAADAVVVAACGVGVQAVAAVVPKPVLPAANTVSYGAFQGIWPGEERCERCGDCVLGQTGGICPLTACSKGLLHGPCGGSQRGECEVEPGRPCGWHRIYERLVAIGRPDLFAQYRPPKDRHRQHDVPLSRRRSTFWALEHMEEV